MENLEYKKKHISEIIDNKTEFKMNDFCKEYKEFLNNKTERECVKYIVGIAKENGFVNLDNKKTLKPNDKVYIVNKNKNVLMAVIGKCDIDNGLNLIASHIDAPRLDLKQNPLYEDNDMALMKTHYYGGIKKYQWTSIPLAMHGVIYNKDNEFIEISIGEDDDDEVFCITDLLPHLAKDQMDKKLRDGVEAEKLNVLVGGSLINDKDISKKVKYNILKILNDRYKIIEKDFFSAEIELVPAFRPKDVGFDRSFVGGYGQDDRVCSFDNLKAILDTDNPDKTCISLFVDKEEIGSAGNTGMTSNFFYESVCEIIKKRDNNCDINKINKVLSNTKCISADVTAAVDPNYKEVDDSLNAHYAGYGAAICKFTGSRGKSGASDANCEFVHELTNIFDKNDVIWQIGELGKVEQGGGGTIAMFITKYNMDVIDIGVPILSMHSPFEIASKYDIYMTYLAYHSMFNSNFVNSNI